MNLGGTIRISRCGMLSLFGLCALVLIYYVATNHEVKGSLAHTLKQQLPFTRKDDLIDLRRLLTVAVEVAERGGAEVAQVRRDADLHEQTKGKTREGVNDPLTDGDLRSHNQMYYGLKKMFPGLTVISEEHAQASAQPNILPLTENEAVRREVDAVALPDLDEPVRLGDVTVWIDPLDATKEYTESLLQYVTTMVCVAVRGRPVIGVIHQPFKEKGVTYWAWDQRGHSKTLVVKDPPSAVPSPLKVLMSMSHTGGKTEQFARQAFGADTEIVSAAGAGYKTLAALWGLGDAYLHTTFIKKWDTCAGDALFRAAGGRLTTLRGAEIDYAATEADKREKIEHGLLGAAGRQLHAALLEKVVKAKQQT